MPRRTHTRAILHLLPVTVLFILATKWRILSEGTVNIFVRQDCLRSSLFCHPSDQYLSSGDENTDTMVRDSGRKLFNPCYETITTTKKVYTVQQWQFNYRNVPRFKSRERQNIVSSALSSYRNFACVISVFPFNFNFPPSS